MKLLISAYVSAPNQGSEQFLGWNWVTQALPLDHEAWALASPVYRQLPLADSKKDDAFLGTLWIFSWAPVWELLDRKYARRERIYNVLWQRGALQAGQNLTRLYTQAQARLAYGRKPLQHRQFH